MKHLFLYILIIFVLKPTAAGSQTAFNDSLSFRSALQKSIDVYHKAISPPTSLYNGPRYAHYTLRFRDGHPYFISPDVAKGYIVLNHIRYENLSFYYDLVRQKIIVYNPAGDAVMVHNDLVREFSQHGQKFIRIDGGRSNLKEGWYALLHEGKIQIVQRIEKTLRSEIVQEGEFFHVDEKKQTYIRTENVFHPVNNRKSVLRLFPDDLPELKKIINSERLSFKRRSFENSLLKLIGHYENTTNRH